LTEENFPNMDYLTNELKLREILDKPSKKKESQEDNTGN